MKRLTHARVDKWGNSVQASEKRVRALIRDIDAYRNHAKGGRYMVLTTLVQTLGDAAQALEDASSEVANVRRHEAAKGTVIS